MENMYPPMVNNFTTRYSDFKNALISSLAMWHIKSIEKQESRWTDGEFNTVKNDLYDKLM